MMPGGLGSLSVASALAVVNTLRGCTPHWKRLNFFVKPSNQRVCPRPCCHLNVEYFIRFQGGIHEK